MKLSSDKIDSYIIYTKTNQVQDKILWNVQFLSEGRYPFDLELFIIKDTYVYTYRIKQDYLMNYFLKYCLSTYEHNEIGNLYTF